jgi:hypothetical protein
MKNHYWCSGNCKFDECALSFLVLFVFQSENLVGASTGTKVLHCTQLRNYFLLIVCVCVCVYYMRD